MKVSNVVYCGGDFMGWCFDVEYTPEYPDFASFKDWLTFLNKPSDARDPIWSGAVALTEGIARLSGGTESRMVSVRRKILQRYPSAAL